MKMNGLRLIDDLKHLRTVTDTPQEGVTRFSYGDMDRQARAYIHEIADALGAIWHQDGVGNIRIGLPGNRPHQKIILAGSHIDTVRNGGWLDGVYGSVSALEVLRTLAESGRSFNKNFEVVIFAEEEGSNFDSTLTGSKFIAGIYGPDQLDHLKNRDGVSLGEMLKTAGITSEADGISEAEADGTALAAGQQSTTGQHEVGGASPVPELPGLPWDFTDIEAMVEMHIEQGPVLTQEGIGIGIVDSIFGMRLVEFELTGLGNHAGASPMEGRRDALTAAAACILLVEKIAGRASGHRGSGSGLSRVVGCGTGCGAGNGPVATAGKLQVIPNCTNVIPEKVIFTVEVRDKDDKVIEKIMEQIIEAALEECEKRQVGMSVREVAQNKAILLPDAMVKRMTELADLRGLDFQVMGSGAVHDASMMAQFVDTGMIFVPSIGGRSHVKEEDTKESDLIAGGNLLLDVILSLLEK
jgi:acetylornithine deacetylase/succinyl-diaminopimelate desuccinylase-like protein